MAKKPTKKKAPREIALPTVEEREDDADVVMDEVLLSTDSKGNKEELKSVDKDYSLLVKPM